MPGAYTIGEMPSPVDPARLAKLARCEPATIGHFRLIGFVDPLIRAVMPERKICGTAVTIAIPGQDSTLLHHLTGMLRPGDVVVIDRLGDTSHACFGGGVALAVKMAGAVGAVIDGFATDFGELREFEMPVWCRGASPITTRLLDVGGTINQPVNCGGVVVHPGDAVLADENGIVVMHPSEIDATADRALAMQEREKTTHKRLRAGEKLGDISGASDRVRAALGGG